MVAGSSFPDGHGLGLGEEPGAGLRHLGAGCRHGGRGPRLGTEVAPLPQVRGCPAPGSPRLSALPGHGGEQLLWRLGPRPPPHLQSQILLSGGGLWLFSLLLPCLALGMLHVPCFLTVPSLPPFSGQHPSPWCFGTHCASISLPGHRSLGHQSWSPVLAPGGRRSLWQAHPGPRVPITVGCDR